MSLTGMMTPVYALKMMITIDTGTVVCSIVLESDPTMRKNIDTVNMVVNMKRMYVKKAPPLRRRLVMK
jgi:hypothetical protein